MQRLQLFALSVLQASHCNALRAVRLRNVLLHLLLLGLQALQLRRLCLQSAAAHLEALSPQSQLLLRLSQLLVQVHAPE